MPPSPVVENVGVPPDTEVEMSPAPVIAGHDPQLDGSVVNAGFRWQY